MERCSGQLVRSFLLAVKPHCMLRPSLFFCNRSQVLLSLQYAVELYSQASFLLNTHLPAAPVLRTLLNLQCHEKPLTNKATSSNEWIARDFSALLLSLSCISKDQLWEAQPHKAWLCAAIWLTLVMEFASHKTFQGSGLPVGILRTWAFGGRSPNRKWACDPICDGWPDLGLDCEDQARAASSLMATCSKLTTKPTNSHVNKSNQQDPADSSMPNYFRNDFCSLFRGIIKGSVGVTKQWISKTHKNGWLQLKFFIGKGGKSSSAS